MATRRRTARGVGEYTDPATGERRIIETSRSVRERHRKYGKHYKEPTKRELRQWARQDELDRRARRLQEEEERRRKNAERRKVKEERQQMIIQQQLSEGRITYSQSLPRIPASQPRLHQFLGRAGAKQPDKRPSLTPDQALSRTSLDPTDIDQEASITASTIDKMMNSPSQGLSTNEISTQEWIDSGLLTQPRSVQTEPNEFSSDGITVEDWNGVWTRFHEIG